MSVISVADFLSSAENTTLKNVTENRALKRVSTMDTSRQHLMRRIGVFELIDGEYVGHIATLNFKCKCVIKENPYRTSEGEADFIVEHIDAEAFYPEIGFAWSRHTDGESLPYLSVHLDDPAFPKTIVGALVRSHENMYFLYWDRVTICDGDIERLNTTEELMPYTGVFRRIAKVTDYLIRIYPSLQEIWDPD